MALLEITGLQKNFGGLKAVNNVSFSVDEGSIKAIIGPNGAGKTTVFNLITGTLTATSGTVTFKGTRIDRKKPHQIAALGMARTFQNIKLFNEMTVLENVMIGRHTKSSAGFLASMCNLPWTWKEEKSIRDKSFELLEMLEISEYADSEATSLAFGQQRAVELARALALEPTLLLLDEPAAGLNITETVEIGKLISRIRALDITVLLVEHDMSLVMDISDDIVVLSFGEKIAEDVPRAIQQNDEVVRVYLGE